MTQDAHVHICLIRADCLIHVTLHHVKSSTIHSYHVLTVPTFLICIFLVMGVSYVIEPNAIEEGVIDNYERRHARMDIRASLKQVADRMTSNIT